MTGKLLVVICLCAFVAIDARPNRGHDGGHSDMQNRGRDGGHRDMQNRGRGGRHGEGANSHDGNQPVGKLQRLCDGLESGNITNEDISYNAVFTSLDAVCLDVAAYQKAQSATSGPVESARRKDSPRGGSRGGSRIKGKRGPRTAVEMLFSTCRRVTRVLANMPTDMAADLVSIYQNMGAVCAAAELVRNPQ